MSQGFEVKNVMENYILRIILHNTDSITDIKIDFRKQLYNNQIWKMAWDDVLTPLY